jgi:hypothetical protein
MDASRKYSTVVEDFEELLDELEARYANVQLAEDSPSIEEILANFDENGNWITHNYCEDNIDDLLKELEEKYANVEVVEHMLSVEDILKLYDDNGNKIEDDVVQVTAKKRRRRQRRKDTKKEEIQILHSNTCGYSSKQECWNDILNNEQPDVVTLNETTLKGKRRIKQKKYFSYCKNRDKNIRGVATLVSNKLKQNTTKVGEGKSGDEYNIVRLDHVQPPLNIINYYGAQESRSANEDILKSWCRLRKDMGDIDRRGEACLLIGDLNRAVGSGNWGVEGNKDTISYGGQLVRDLLETEDYTLLNNLDLVEGGPWTWTSRSNPKIKSCLDLGIISRNLLPFVHRVIVDEEQKFTPFRVIKRKSGLISCFSDHLSLKVILRGMASAGNPIKEKETIWNLNKVGGWERYIKKTDEAAEQIKDIVNNGDNSIEEVMDKVNKLENKIKFSSFGKIKKKCSQKHCKELTMKAETVLAKWKIVLFVRRKQIKTMIS